VALGSNITPLGSALGLPFPRGLFFLSATERPLSPGHSCPGLALAPRTWRPCRGVPELKLLSCFSGLCLSWVKINTPPSPPKAHPPSPPQNSAW